MRPQGWCLRRYERAGDDDDDNDDDKSNVVVVLLVFVFRPTWRPLSLAALVLRLGRQRGRRQPGRNLARLTNYPSAKTIVPSPSFARPAGSPIRLAANWARWRTWLGPTRVLAPGKSSPPVGSLKESAGRQLEAASSAACSSSLALKRPKCTMRSGMMNSLVIVGQPEGRSRAPAARC